MSKQCPFFRGKDLGGKPGTGVHAWRLGGPRGTTQGLAGFDFMLTVVAAGGLTALMRCKWYWSIPVFIILWAVGVVFHRLFCVSTPVTRRLFGV
jgi:hypothetical protein